MSCRGLPPEKTSPQKFWWVLRVKISPDGMDRLLAELFALGSVGLQEKEGEMVAYFPSDVAGEKVAHHLRHALSGAGFEISIAIEKIPDEDWGARWPARPGPAQPGKGFFKPIRVTKRLLILPCWKRPPSAAGQIVIRIKPGPAFGTGSHATTRMVLQLLEKYFSPKEHQDVLDVGTGSGILAIAAVKLGAKRVLALDIDSQALENARENVEINQVMDTVELRLGSLDHWGEIGEFPLVLANLTSGIILELLDPLTRVTCAGGLLILSGITEGERESFLNQIPASDWELLETREDEGWIALVLRRRTPA